MRVPPAASHSEPGSVHTDRERRLDAAIAEYLEAVGAGRSVEREEFLARHSDLAPALLSFFAAEDRLRALAGPLPPPAGAEPGAPQGKVPLSASDTKLAPGRVLGDFELLEEIACGGMGVVFRARQRSLNRIVALKTIRPDSLRPGDDALDRFRIEAEAVARLDHPNIVPLYEMGEHAGCPFLSLKLISGGDLERHVALFGNDLKGIARLMAQVARAVQYAHERGILHRDLKPSNILLDEQGNPHVTDFGLAKCLGNESGLTHTGLILGTPSYMAPEQVAGRRGEVTTAADVYGLGAVLYKLLTGRPPFQADTVYETLQQVREREPPRPSSCTGPMDRDLEAICLKCLEKDPPRRYSSAEAMARDLDRWLAGESIAARPVGPVARGWRWCRRNPLVATLWAAVAGLLVTITALASAAAVREHALAAVAAAAAKRAEEAAGSEHSARLLADARAAEIRWRLVRVNVASGNRAVEQGDHTGALPWFAEAFRLDGGDPAAAAVHRLRLGTVKSQCPTLAGVFFHEQPINAATLDRAGRRLATASSDGTACVWNVTTGRPVTPPLVHEGPVNWVEFSADGTLLVTASDDRTIRVWDAASGRPAGAGELPHGSPVRLAVFSPDGRHIASAGFDGTMRVWGAGTQRPVVPAVRHGQDLFSVAFSPDGRRIATGSSDGTARIWQLENDAARVLATIPHRAPVRHVAFSPEGSRLVTASHDGTARVWDGRTGKPLTPPLAHELWVFYAEFSPDGKRIVTASHDGSARVWDARTGRPITPAGRRMGHSVAVRDASFSPDGARIVTAGYDGTARVWDASTGAPLTPPLFHGGNVQRARFGPDGTRVLTISSDATARLWDLTTVGSPAVMVELALGSSHAAFDPLGKHFATACNDGTARIWDGASGRPCTPVMAHAGAITRVAYKSDGRYLATASADGTARIWDAQTGTPASPPLLHSGPVLYVCFSSDGLRLATASADARARIWDVRTGKIMTPPLDHDHRVLHIAFSPDGQLLATGSEDCTARVWDVSSGKPVTSPLRHDALVSCVAFHPSGRVLLTACSDESLVQRQAQQWDLATGRPIGPPLRHGDGVLWVVYSADGHRMATASEDRTARVWNSDTGEPITPPLHHRHQVLMVDFSPDGGCVATCSSDGTARVWDATTGEALSPPLPHQTQTKVGFVTFRPDGRSLLTAGLDGTVRVWPLARNDGPLEVLVGEAQVCAGRKIDQTGSEVPLGSDELASAWARVRGERGGDRMLGEGAAATELQTRVAWHRREARRLEMERQGSAAAWHLERIAAIDSKDPSVLDRLVAAHELSSDWENVERVATRVLLSGPPRVDVRVRRAWARIHLGRPAQAAADFHDALEKEPDATAIRLGLFVAVAELESTAKANALFSREINDHDEPLSNRWKAAAAHLFRLTERRPKCWWYWRALGHVHMSVGQTRQAEAAFGEAIKLNPDDGWSWLGRGLARKKLGRNAEALVDFSRSITLEPSLAASWGARGEIHGERGDWDQAASDFAQWAERGGGSAANLWYHHAALRLHAGDRAGYRRACASMWKRFGQVHDAYVAMLVVRACTLVPDPEVPADLLVDLARQAAGANPYSAWYVSGLGSALRRAGRLEEAVSTLNEAMRVDGAWPGHPLTAAHRELAEQSLARQAEGPSEAGRERHAQRPTHMDRHTLEHEISRAGVVWPLRLEASLLGRELEAFESRNAAPG